jgi:hypothetical protein
MSEEEKSKTKTYLIATFFIAGLTLSLFIYTTAYSNGFNDGSDDGFDRGYDSGYNNGYNDGIDNLLRDVWVWNIGSFDIGYNHSITFNRTDTMFHRTWGWQSASLKSRYSDNTLWGHMVGEVFYYQLTFRLNITHEEWAAGLDAGEYIVFSGYYVVGTYLPLSITWANTTFYCGLESTAHEGPLSDYFPN